ncbi:unnamed protein product [Periconia digitata]|uniref:Uncharacterized protein n=1 Tax=Periconia digitata TaxID=1303443 RepID=A0A9W4XNP8_9PLEO|nr:unnamed protein product [Periconia digitata]
MVSNNLVVHVLSRLITSNAVRMPAIDNLHSSPPSPSIGTAIDKMNLTQETSSSGQYWTSSSPPGLPFTSASDSNSCIPSRPLSPHGVFPFLTYPHNTSKLTSPPPLRHTPTDTGGKKEQATLLISAFRCLSRRPSRKFSCHHQFLLTNPTSFFLLHSLSIAAGWLFLLFGSSMFGPLKRTPGRNHSTPPTGSPETRTPLPLPIPG